MGSDFNAHLEVVIDFKNGKPFFDKDGQENFDLSKIPQIPAQFEKFVKLESWWWGDVFDVKEDTGKVIYVNNFRPRCVDMGEEEGDEVYAPLEEYLEFESFCKWMRDSGVSFRYSLSY